jgi:TetR/AcrR family transcriptional repressor of nem operon
VGHTQTDKLATHNRIVKVAAKRFRERGIDGISVADVMKEAGLTVGGFYKHFESRDVLVAEAVSEAFCDLEPFEAAITVSPRQAMRMYISESHRDRVETSCPISSLVNDVARSTDETRDVYTEHVRKIIDSIAKMVESEDASTKRAEAMLIFSACVGSIGLARAINDPKLSKQILDNVLRQILNLLTS